MPGNLIRSAVLSGSEALIQSHGKRAAGIALRAGIPMEALRDPDILISGSAAILFFEIAAQTCENRTWGLQLSRNARLAAVLGPLWILLHNARNVRQMLEDFSAYFELYSSAAVVTWEKRLGGGELSWSAAAGKAVSDVQMAEFSLSTIGHEIASHMPHNWTPKAVGFRHAAPKDLRLHRQLFCEDVFFDQDRNSLFLDDATLDRPLHSAGHARSLIRGVLQHENVVARASRLQVVTNVESIVRALLPFSACTLKEVSQAMGLPTRTLQEHLQRAGGKTFKQIKDGVRADLAMKYLQHSQMPVGQIADVLGYADITAFSRSFRRWHGRSAREVRATSLH